MVPPLLIVLAGYDVLYLVVWAWHGHQPIFGDFFALWSFARFAVDRVAVAIYDPTALSDFQHQVDPALPSGSYPFPYPPSFLLILWPLGHMRLLTAYLVWVCGTLVLYLAATLGRTWRPLNVLALLVSRKRRCQATAAISGVAG